MESFNCPATGVNETHLIQLIQRPLQTKRQQEPNIRNHKVLNKHPDTEWPVLVWLVWALTKRPFLLFSLICWPRLSSSSWWTCRYDLTTKTHHRYSLSLSHHPAFVSDVTLGSRPLQSTTNRAWDVFTHCKPLRKAAYTSSSRSGWGVLVGGSLVEPVNILLPYKARFSWIKQCWGRER